MVVGDCEERLPWDDSMPLTVFSPFTSSSIFTTFPPHWTRFPTYFAQEAFPVVIPCKGGKLYSLGRHMTTKRIFEKRYQMPYEWMIRQDHCNTAPEVLDELLSRFQVRRRSYFPSPSCPGPM